MSLVDVSNGTHVGSVYYFSLLVVLDTGLIARHDRAQLRGRAANWAAILVEPQVTRDLQNGLASCRVSQPGAGGEPS